MVPNNITKEHINTAIAEIDQKGVQNGAHSTTYDLIHNGNRYPPKLVLSLANKYANGNELDRSTFTGGDNTEAFNYIKNLGFKIDVKSKIPDLIKDFLEQSKTDSLATSQYLKTYRNLKVKVSFGAGNAARIPWIGFLKSPNKIQNGIYPALLLFKDKNYLILAYGTSETSESNSTWDLEGNETLNDWHLKKFNKKPDRYGESIIKSVYNLNESVDYSKLQTELDEMIDRYESINFNLLNEPHSNYDTSKTNPKKNYWIYSPGENAEYWDEFYQKGIMGLGWDYIGDLKKYDSKEQIISKMQEVEQTNGSKKNDATACDDFYNKMSIGDVVIAKKGRSTLIGYGTVISDYYYDNERQSFQKLRKVNWKKKGEWNAGLILVLKTLTDITRYPSKLSEYDHYYERLLAIMDETIKEPKKLIDLPLNTILYGPPGTGKTFKLQNEFFDDFTVKETSLSRSQYLENIISDLTWWQVLSIILLDTKKTKVNDITEHELLIIKGNLSNSKTVRPTVWGRLQAHTKLECLNVNVADRSQPAIFYKDEGSYWTVDEVLLEQYYPEAFSILDQVKNFRPSNDKLIKNYEFVTFHQSFSYEDFIEGIKPKLGDQENEIAYEIQDGIFKKLCLKANADRDNDYAIFIDEINRGNVSAIFGELITLIEKDKRLGEENELSARLPYSKEELGVPPNLYIFGTMNTADRSVEALDTALRRRFSFEEVMPLPTLLKHIEFEDFDLSQVLSVINDRVEALLDRDHTIGHSYFMNIESGDVENLKQAFENKIIPLLQEYFYHDYEKLALILGEGFVAHKDKNIKFAKFKDIDQPEINSSFELKNINDIQEAVQILLNLKDEKSE